MSLHEGDKDTLAERLRLVPAPKRSEQERLEGFLRLGRAMHAAWEQTAGDEALWQARIDGPVYRQTPLLGRFRWYRRFRVWQLRRSLK